MTKAPRWGLALIAAAGLLVGACGARAQSEPGGDQTPSFSSLPNWSGVWLLEGGYSVARESPPPLTPEWRKKADANLEKSRQHRLPDPLTVCGMSPGFPRLLDLPDGYEFVIRPEQTWILAEYASTIMRIYTDGRPHLGPDDTWDTYTGDSVGHWEGQTLIIDTVALKGEPYTELDRSGLTYSNKAHVTTRLQLVDKDTLQAIVMIRDPLMLTQPWTFTKYFKRAPPGTRAYDYVCAENNRNPVAASGETLTLGPNGKPLDKQIDPAPK